MYNDYYLQSIDNKLNTTNKNLDEIISNQETMLISGDIIQNDIKQIKEINQGIVMYLIVITILFTSYMIHHIFDYTWKEK